VVLEYSNSWRRRRRLRLPKETKSNRGNVRRVFGTEGAKIRNPRDVLCGRGGAVRPTITLAMLGTVPTPRLVKSYQRLYVDAPFRDKPKVAQCIVFAVRVSGGRFLKRDVLCASGTDEMGGTVIGKDKITQDTPSSRSCTKLLSASASSSALPSTSAATVTAPSPSPGRLRGHRGLELFVPRLTQILWSPCPL
jgi:hypothetical protein